MAHTTSLTLLERLAQGADDADWTKLLSIYRPFIQYQVRSYADLADQADDISQEVMLVLMRDLPTFERQRKGSFRSWLRTVTVNQLRTAARRSRRQPRPAGAQPDVLQQIEDLADPVSLASVKWDEEHDLAVMRRVFELIRPKFEASTWLAFERHGLKGEPANQVAASLGISANAVMLAKSRVLSRARKEAKGFISED